MLHVHVVAGKILMTNDTEFVSKYSFMKYRKTNKIKSWRARVKRLLKMSKQSTLFKAWGGRKEKTINQTNIADRPSTSTSVPAADPAEEYEIPDDDNFDDFLDDALTDVDLIQAYDDGNLAGASSSSAAAAAGGSSSDLPQNLHQKTLAFHVGPSHSLLNSSIIEEDIPGFDPEAGELWIYPTNYPIRDYQFNIVQKALFTNTLVCLPTGLGKTFIAAVVMYNFYRWYPNSKIVFLAPTKPLVTQQIEACYKVMGIPQEHAAEMTGMRVYLRSRAISTLVR